MCFWRSKHKILLATFERKLKLILAQNMKVSMILSEVYYSFDLLCFWVGVNQLLRKNLAVNGLVLSAL